MTNAPESPTTAIPSHSEGKSPHDHIQTPVFLKKANQARLAGDHQAADVYIWLYQLEVQRGQPAGLPSPVR